MADSHAIRGVRTNCECVVRHSYKAQIDPDTPLDLAHWPETVFWEAWHTIFVRMG